MPITHTLCSVCKVDAVTLGYQGVKSINFNQIEGHRLSSVGRILAYPASTPSTTWSRYCSMHLLAIPAFYMHEILSQNCNKTTNKKHLKHCNTSTNSLKTKETAGTQCNFTRSLFVCLFVYLFISNSRSSTTQGRQVDGKKCRNLETIA